MAKSIGSLQQCSEEIYGKEWNGKTCVNDADCYTTCDPVSSRCVIPWAHPELYLAQCLTEELPDFILRYFKYNLNLPGDATAPQLSKAIANLTSTQICVGPTAFEVWHSEIRFEQISHCFELSDLLQTKRSAKKINSVIGNNVHQANPIVKQLA